MKFNGMRLTTNATEEVGRHGRHDCQMQGCELNHRLAELASM